MSPTAETIACTSVAPGGAFSVSPWYAWQDRDRDHDSVRVRAFALKALEQLKANFAVVSESALVLGDETSIIVRSVDHRLWVPAFSHR